jgi:hypothetical protein
MALLSSEHFFDPENYGVMIKNPWDFIMSALKSLEVQYSQPLAQRYDSWYSFFGRARQMQMEYFQYPRRGRVESLFPGAAVLSQLDQRQYACPTACN